LSVLRGQQPAEPPPPPSPSLLEKLIAAVESVGNRVEALASSLRPEPAGPRLDAIHGKLDAARATLNHVDAKLDLAEFERAKNTRKIIRAVRGTGVLAVAAIAFLLNCQHAPATRTSGSAAVSPPAQTINVNVGTGQGVGAVAAQYEKEDERRLNARPIAEGDMDKTKKKGRPVPHTRLRYQAVAPCQGTETTLHGLCWLKIADYSSPCPPDLYEEGNACYKPVHEMPTPPKSETTQPPNPEQR
jgi:hypothetical protein